MAVPRNALKKWEKVREFALALPGATEATRRSRTSIQPWGETVGAIAPKRLISELDER